MRSPHDLHGVFDMAPLFCFFRLALALASDRFLGRLGDSLQAVLLEHLPRDHVNLRLGYHVALPDVPPLGASGDRCHRSSGFLLTIERELSFRAHWTLCPLGRSKGVDGTRRSLGNLRPHHARVRLDVLPKEKT